MDLDKFERFTSIFNLELPGSVLDKVVVLFLDGNRDNWEVLKDRVGETVANVSVICRNIENNTVHIYPSIGIATRETGVNYGTVQTQMELEPDCPVYGWNFRRLSSFESWPVYTEKHLQIFRDNPHRPGCGIEVYDCDKNEMLFFTSDVKAGEHFGISPITVSKLARYNQIRQKRFKFKLFKVN